jgi:hypothetical protein
MCESVYFDILVTDSKVNMEEMEDGKRIDYHRPMTYASRLAGDSRRVVELSVTFSGSGYPL